MLLTNTKKIGDKYPTYRGYTVNTEIEIRLAPTREDAANPTHIECKMKFLVSRAYAPMSIIYGFKAPLTDPQGFEELLDIYTRMAIREIDSIIDDYNKQKGL